MLVKCSGQHRDLCVLRVNRDVLDVPHVVITDQNAASSYRRWGASPDDLYIIDSKGLFAEWWTRHEDWRENLRHASQMCAEVLVPDLVAPDFLVGVYVSRAHGAAAARRAAPGLPVSVNRHLFFLGPSR